MNYRIAGISSIGLAFVSISITAYRLFSVSLAIGAAYTACVPLVFLNVLYVYCKRCPHVGDASCRHVVFGPIVARLFKQTSPQSYTMVEVLIALAPLATLIMFPQFWLWQTPILFIVFWILLASAGIIVIKGVCPLCKNTSCAMCSRTI